MYVDVDSKPDEYVILLALIFALTSLTTNSVFAIQNESELTKNSAFELEMNYSKYIQKLESDIKLAENALTDAMFEDQTAKTKIDNAVLIKDKAKDSLDKAKEKLNQGSALLKQHNYEQAYKKFLEIGYNVDDITEKLKELTQEISLAKKLEEEFQEKNKFCFLFWCFGGTNDYSGLNEQIKELESKTNEIISTMASSVSQLPQNLPQMNDNSVELENLKQTNLQQQAELEQKQQELQKLQKIKLQQQEQLELEKQQCEQERQEYENRIEAEKREKIEALASKYPIIKGIMSGTIHYYIEQVPDYALPEINLEVVPQIEQMLQSQSSVDVPFQRVYEKSSADFVVTWKRDIGTHLGTSWRYVNEVGLGSSTCWEDWVPFDSRTVKRITWHEIGHAVGFWHSQDTRNVMYEFTDDRNIYEIDQSYALDEGSWKWLKFCESGSYNISIKSSEKNHGFKAYLIPSSEDPNNFRQGQYYSNCSTDDEYTSWSEECSVEYGDYLIVYNPNDLLKFSAIDVSVKIVDIREREPVISKWDPETFNWFDQSLMNEVLSNYKPAH